MMKKIDKSKLLNLVVTSGKLNCEDLAIYSLLLTYMDDESGQTEMEIKFGVSCFNDCDTSLFLETVYLLQEQDLISVIEKNDTHIKVDFKG